MDKPTLPETDFHPRAIIRASPKDFHVLRREFIPVVNY